MTKSSGNRWCILMVLGAPIVAMAQTAPDAGSLQQQIERERQQQAPKRAAPAVPAPPAAMNAALDVTVKVKEFRLVGNTLLSREQLTPGLDGYLNRPLGFAQLMEVVGAVAARYRDAGWVARVYLPEQDIRDGVVTLQVVEAVLGKLAFEGTPPRRVEAGRIRRIIESAQQAGALLSGQAINRALLLADELPGVTVSGRLATGANERETDLFVKVEDEPLFSADVTADNTGSRASGRERLSASLFLASPLGLGDQVNGNLIHTRGSDYIRIAGSLPVGFDGWRIGLSGSSLDYRLVTSEFAALNVRGSSRTVGIEASYPLVRSRDGKLTFSANFDQKRFDNAAADSTTARYDLGALSMALSGHRFDDWGGGGTSSASLSLSAGMRRNLAGTTDQHFGKLRYSASRMQVLAHNLVLSAQVSGQESDDSLDSSEQFYLGGVSGVRAYPTSEASGASGALASLELRLNLTRGFTLTGFLDSGHVRNRDGMPSLSLSGYGLSLAWQGPAGADLKATWSRRLGHNPNPTADGHDQDGSLVRNRVWLTASLPF